MDGAYKRLAATKFFTGLSTGALITSISFYLCYGYWQPLVWAAGITAFVQILQNLIGSVP